jgi:signal transduction histidine kinase
MPSRFREFLPLSHARIAHTSDAWQGGATGATSAFPVRRWSERRVVVLAAAAGLFAAIFALRQTSTDGADATELLYVVPISLVALELGLLAGVAAAALALGLVGIWMLSSPAGLDGVGMFTRGVAFLAVGTVAGRFADRMRDARDRQHLLLQSGLTLAHLTGANDLPATLAHRARELVACRGTRVELTGRPSVDSGVPGDMLEHLPIEARGIRYGTLGVSASISAEDRAALTVLALQAAVAAENRRLLEGERERAVIRAELQDARLHLADRGDQVHELIARHEAERHYVAHELHEQAAQTLAAVLLGLGALERDLDSEIAAPKLDTLRSGVDSTLRSLRSLAVSLRPPALALGLQAALERLADDARSRGFDEMTVDMQGVDGLNEETETMAYRVVEEALHCAGTARLVSVRAEAGGRQLVIVAQGVRRSISREQLAVLRARMELAGGTLSATAAELHAVIPLSPGRESPRSPTHRA